MRDTLPAASNLPPPPRDECRRVGVGILDITNFGVTNKIFKKSAAETVVSYGGQREARKEQRNIVFDGSDSRRNYSRVLFFGVSSNSVRYRIVSNIKKEQHKNCCCF